MKPGAIHALLHCPGITLHQRTAIIRQLAPDHWELRDWGQVVAMRWDDASKAPQDLAAKAGDVVCIGMGHSMVKRITE